MSKEKEILRFVIEYKMDHNGNSPSYDQIMDACEISSKSEVKRILEGMEGAGLLNLNGRRGIEIPNSEWQMNSIGESDGKQNKTS